METKEYILDEDEGERLAYKEKKKEENKEPMGDVYDVYGKAVGVHSKVSDMTEDYTLTRYDKDIYLEKFPRFIREQRKLLRIMKTYIIIPLEVLKSHYNSEEKARRVHEGLKREYEVIQELIIGELDECVIMGRTPRGEVINAFLKHGLQQEEREMLDIETEKPELKNLLRERKR